MNTREFAIYTLYATEREIHSKSLFCDQSDDWAQVYFLTLTLPWRTTCKSQTLHTALHISFRKLIIIFTRQEEYIRKGKSFEEFLRSAPLELKTLLKQCHYRCVGFNNMALLDGNQKENAKQVSVLLKLVDKADVEDTSKSQSCKGLL